jgi:uncharacterized protein (DUF1778 family)
MATDARVEIRMPIELKRQLRIAAALRDQTLGAYMRDAALFYAKSEAAVPGKEAIALKGVGE